jgi:hypothetical protein
MDGGEESAASVLLVRYALHAASSSRGRRTVIRGCPLLGMVAVPAGRGVSDTPMIRRVGDGVKGGSTEAAGRPPQAIVGTGGEVGT